MNKLVELLAQYASYHRDRRNILTHFVGIPMIMLSVTVLLTRTALGDLAGHTINLAMVAATLLAVYYLTLDLRLGMVMSGLLALSVLAALGTAALSTPAWLAVGLGLFVVGWVIQFLGHHYEGRKPAFVDDVIGLLIGPLFVVAEAAFLLGLRKEIEAAITQKAGTVH
jgi:uncharacterized membrane protein YGL010W